MSKLETMVLEHVFEWDGWIGFVFEVFRVRDHFRLASACYCKSMGVINVEDERLMFLAFGLQARDKSTSARRRRAFEIRQ